MLDLEKLLKIPGADSEYGSTFHRMEKQWHFLGMPAGSGKSTPFPWIFPPRLIASAKGWVVNSPLTFRPTNPVSLLPRFGWGENFDIWLYDILTAKHLNLTPTPNMPSSLK
jgi:hypothetical protein